ncbi:MAG: lantibiotic dehydratase family protein [Pyrinomonadaceae bacterium]|nr:lantibiotic dehydratase family protein [Pyrinomonadaceae bacterium]
MSENHNSNAGKHLISLDQDWFVWKDFCLRSAGFDIALIRELTVRESISAAEEIYKLEIEIGNLRRKIIEALYEKMSISSDAEIKKINKLKNKFRKDIIADYNFLPAEIIADFQAYEKLKKQNAERKAKFAEQYNADWEDAGRKLWNIGKRRDLQEAIIWQNRQAYRDFIKPWLETPLEISQKNIRSRRKELLLTNYLQRYTTKNDSIGFFGPVTWGKITESRNGITLNEGENFLSYRNVFTEGWAIDILADTFVKETEETSWLKPKKFPFVRVEGDKLFVADEKPQSLPRKFVSVLQLCNGTLDLSEITRKVIEDSESGIDSEREVFNIIQMLEKRQIISNGLEVPWIADFPAQMTFEEKLAEYIEKIGKAEAKKGIESKFAEYLSALDETRNSAGNVEKLDRSLEDLEAVFTELTGKNANRNAGKTYAGRTIVFEDCRRDVSVLAGKNIVEAIFPALNLLFKSTRWLTGRTAELFNQAFETTFRETLQRTGSQNIEFYEFWKQVNGLFFHETSNLTQEIVPEFQRKWQKILNIPGDKNSVNYSSDELTQAVENEFPAEFPGWSTAKYNSPDIMISAADIDQLNCGDFLYVMGELHLGVNTLMNSMFVRVSENPAEIMKGFFEDFPNPRFIIVPPKEMVTSRNYPLFNLSKDFYLGFTKNAVDLGRGNYLEISDLIVEKIDGELFVVSRNGKLRFPLKTVFADILSGICTNLFKMIEQTEHTPRITIDQLVVRREAWRLAFSELSFAFPKESHERFLEAQIFRRQRNLPKEVFIKITGEIKPFYLNFESPHLVENVCKNIKNQFEQNEAGSAVFSELLPSFENLWFTNRKNEHFTSEFRFVFVDKKGLHL